MLDIYICEDNPTELKLFSKYVSDLILIENLDMQLTLASSNPHELIKKLSRTSNIGIFFLDIDLKTDLDGLKLAQHIREIQPRCYIIFVTSHHEMGLITFQYKVEALDFIVKSTPENVKSKIHACLIDIAKKHAASSSRHNEFLVIKQGERQITIDYDEILFLETSENIHKIVLHAQTKMLEFPGQLKDVAQQLDSRFYRCHRSYLVNKDNIAEVNYKDLIILMNNGEKCPLSVRMKKGLKNALK